MTEQKQKFATASTVSEDTIGKPEPKLGPDDIQRLRLVAESAFSSGWWVDKSGRVQNSFGYVVAEVGQRSDAVVIATFSPEVLHGLLDLAEQALDIEPTLR